jgi:gas vesicle protein
MTTSLHLEIQDRILFIRQLEIQEPEVVEYISRLHEDEREATFVHALQVGVFCLQRAQVTQDTDFVRRQIERLLADVTQAVERIPNMAERAIVGKIGIENGQLLAPIHNLVTEVSRTTSGRLSDVRDLLTSEIDPGKDSSTVGKALRTLRDLLDPKRSDSVQGSIQAAVSQVTSENGALAKSIKAVVSDAMEPFQNQLTTLTMEVRGNQVAAEVLEQTPAKGITYEEEVLEDLRAWAQSTGIGVEYVGQDNQPGDFILDVSRNSVLPNPFSIVVEVRNRQSAVGRKSISDTLAKAMDTRSATAAIYVSKTRDGLAQEVGEWAEGIGESGPWVACTDEHKLTAVRFLIVQERLSRLREAAEATDCASIEAQVQRIRTSLDRVKKISRRVGDVRTNADEIQQEAEALRDEIKDALTTVEDAIRKPTAQNKGPMGVALPATAA